MSCMHDRRTERVDIHLSRTSYKQGVAQRLREKSRPLPGGRWRSNLCALQKLVNREGDVVVNRGLVARDKAPVACWREMKQKYACICRTAA